MKPTIGRIVHFYQWGLPCEPNAAIITGIVMNYDEWTVGLCIFNQTGMEFNHMVEFSPEPKTGCWSWPPRE